MYSLTSLGWPVNVVGPVLANVVEDVIRPLHTNRLHAHLTTGPRRTAGYAQLAAGLWAMRKMFIFADLSRQAPPESVVVLIDAGDVMAQLPPSAFAAAWASHEQRGGKPVVRGADVGCYPFTGAAYIFGCGDAWRKTYQLGSCPCDLVAGQRGVNGGLLAGRGRDIDAYYDSLASFIVAAPRVCVIPEEQAVLLLHYLGRSGELKCRGCRAEGPEIHIDRESRIFHLANYNKSTAKWLSAELEPRQCPGGDQLAIANSSHPAPALIHFPGDAKFLVRSRCRLGGPTVRIGGFWGPLGKGSMGEAEAVARRTATREVSVDGAAAKLGALCAPPTATSPSRLVKYWSHPMVQVAGGGRLGRGKRKKMK
eukprot:TRINITY_DN11052_c0_g1_i3.p1 TRINITY_DN11052_c0_g1~~TRINITY_DN11052_c0_g1_i3.p1  ORF type:complete len:366 (+),score=75.04 TRINITY_DN11052_c0_g1_i3:555-1652(+)